ncbi:TIGR03619 family F420-dependent LLM class oxidoreductase [Mycolicibacterium holsaticum]|nr:TIGR03619 family F420-dependent LLM class oxidoreductase [Mycolicibacterium holsaticum]QZA13892.1 TIGR03619 family F420-dependent LLM class oxidoreductase [Mycolicibacterium holsaticum DSM 44478 = JCM 12374]UNC08648.1 TIGR03619 family F420-dependent LLM class oxidoreductase [Mycolicibacterium holsaticum DSM 44478 = JCM 12374]
MVVLRPVRPYSKPKVGIWLSVVEPDQLVGFAQDAELAGCDSVWVPEHLIWPDVIRSKYPYRDDGAPPVPSAVNLYDPWVLLGGVASKTTTIRLGTCVYVLPLRDPLVTARAVATLDILSGGRVILGAGLGWMAEEFAAAGIDFRTRAARCDEIVPVLRSLWSNEITSSNGRFVKLPPVHFNPKPPRGAKLPIVFGGESEHALRRAARLGNGWLGTWHTPESTRDVVARIGSYLAEYGRGDEDFEITVMVSPREVTEQVVVDFYQAGADRICVGSPRAPLRVWPEVLEKLGTVLQSPALR